jgi:hypothetical protein
VQRHLLAEEKSAAEDQDDAAVASLVGHNPLGPGTHLDPAPVAMLAVLLAALLLLTRGHRPRAGYST